MEPDPKSGETPVPQISLDSLVTDAPDVKYVTDTPEQAVVEPAVTLNLGEESVPKPQVTYVVPALDGSLMSDMEPDPSPSVVPAQDVHPIMPEPVSSSVSDVVNQPAESPHVEGNIPKVEDFAQAGIPIKVNMPEPEHAETPPLNQEEGSFEPTGMNKNLMIGGTVLVLLVVAIIIFLFTKDVFNGKGGAELPAPAQEPFLEENTGASQQETQAVLRCLDNEVLDSSNNCVCKPNYTKGEDMSGPCEYDCTTAVVQIQSMRINPSVSSSTDMADQLAALEKDAIANNCTVPVGAGKCGEYKNSSMDALKAENYQLYYDISKKYIQENCGPVPLDACGSKLAEAGVINNLLSLNLDTQTAQTFKDRLDSIKTAYYIDDTCNDKEARCMEITKQYGQNPESASQQVNQESPATDISAAEFSPSGVFKDDKEYYYKYCIPKEESVPAEQVTQLMFETQQPVETPPPAKRPVPRKK